MKNEFFNLKFVSAHCLKASLLCAKSGAETVIKMNVRELEMKDAEYMPEWMHDSDVAGIWTRISAI